MTETSLPRLVVAREKIESNPLQPQARHEDSLVPAVVSNIQPSLIIDDGSIILSLLKVPIVVSIHLT